MSLSPSEKRKRRVGLRLPQSSVSLLKTNNLSSEAAEVAALPKQLEKLEVSNTFKIDLKESDLRPYEELGSGNGGTVNKILHVPTGTIMARKVIHVEANATVRKQILRELQILHDCNSIYIVSFYGSFITEGDLSICMEYMDLGSLDSIYKKTGAIREPILADITYSVLKGLLYLYETHRIIHRDIKPSNILMNSSGQIKLADFGVSGQLVNSVANTFVGTSHYMAPERIQGGKYSVQSDVWSLGITMMELAIGKFPFPPEGIILPIFDLLQYIVNEPVPPLPEGQFSPEFQDFTNKCLIKDPSKRPNFKYFMKHKFVIKAKESNIDMKAWAQEIAEKIKNN